MYNTTCKDSNPFARNVEQIVQKAVYMNEDVKQTVQKEDLESSWIRAFLSGDLKAFDRLVLCYKERVFNLCYRMLGDYDEANDSAQETFVKVFRSLKDFRFASSFSTWLYTIATNTCRNRIQSQEYRYRKKMVRIDPCDPEGQERCCDLEDPAPSPLAQLTQKERDIQIQRAIDTLSPEHRTVVVLRDFEGLSYEEIARITGYSPGTVKSKLSRARHRLCEQLKGVI